MTDEERDVRKRFEEEAAKEGLCKAFHVFTLGANGTVYVGCGHPDRHWEPDVIDVGVTYPFHQSQQGKPDGPVVIFRWPVEVKE